MSKYSTKLLPLLLLAISAAGPAAASQFIVDLAPGVSVSTIATRYGLTVLSTLSGKAGVYLVSAPDPMPASLLQTVNADPGVQVVDLGDEVALTATPQGTAPSGLMALASTLASALTPVADISVIAPLVADKSTLPYFGSTVRTIYARQPGTDMIHLQDVLSKLAQGSGVVAVIDTGVDPNHPALKNSLLPGYDFTRDTPGGSEMRDLQQSTVAILDQSTVAILDSKNTPLLLNQSTVAILDQSTVAILDGSQLPSAFGHGTMVAGLIHVVAPGARILPLKAFRADGTSDIAGIVRAIYYAVDNRADVINMSFSTLTQSPAISAAVQYAIRNRVICVASVGNYGKRQTVYPAGDTSVIGVASVDYNDKRSVFSDFGSAVEVSSPGEALITTYPGGNYAAVWGTSFSTALVSGGAALLVDIWPWISPYNAEECLEKGHPPANDMGEGRLDVAIAVQTCLNKRND
jgi:subtilisin family serine protease